MLFVLVLFIFCKEIKSLTDCDNVLSLSDSKYNNYAGECNNKWKNLKSLLKPCQKDVGYSWVWRQVQKNFLSESDAQKYIDDNLIPAVIGPDSFIYITDGHHKLCALDYQKYDEVSVTLNITCDFRQLSSMDEFWEQMQLNNLIYLGSHPNNDSNLLPQAIEPSTLPKYFSFTNSNSSFQNDQWRSLSSFSRKVNSAYYDGACDANKNTSDVCLRCFYRGCGDGQQAQGASIPFFEFQWAYFMQDSTLSDEARSFYWTDQSQLQTFLHYYDALPEPSLATLSDTNITAWSISASYIIPVCRSKNTQTFTLPQSIFNGIKYLAGYTQGNTELPDDPDCDSTCNSSTCCRIQYDNNILN